VSDVSTEERKSSLRKKNNKRINLGLHLDTINDRLIRKHTWDRHTFAPQPPCLVSFLFWGSDAWWLC